eukprot:GAHX01002863.1.p1 GENE.GAHX01002863.1~~GAHX01002863.1.p1  ORF type:complete len:219 (+),score=34.63 GAHX01002863.1:1666-2322(+)
MHGREYNDVSCNCYFTGYFYKGDINKEEQFKQESEDYQIVSDDLVFRAVLFPKDLDFTKERIYEPEFCFYQKYKEDIWGSKFINEQPMEVHLLVTKNTMAYQQMVGNLEGILPEDKSSLITKIPSLRTSKDNALIEHAGIYFMKGYLLCELKDRKLFVLETKNMGYVEGNFKYKMGKLELNSYWIDWSKSYGYKTQQELEILLKFISIEDKNNEEVII